MGGNWYEKSVPAHLYFRQKRLFGVYLWTAGYGVQ